MGISHKSVGTSLTQNEWEAASSHVLDAVGLPYASVSSDIATASLGTVGSILQINSSSVPAFMNTLGTVSMTGYLDLYSTSIAGSVTGSIWYDNTSSTVKVRDGTGASFIGYKECCRVYSSVNIVLNTGSQINLTFTNEYFDTDNMFNSASGTKIDINTAGKYAMTFDARWDSSSIGYRLIACIYNGTTNITLDSRNAVNGLATWQNATGIWDCSAGSYITVQGLHNNGGTASITYAAEGSPVFSVWRIG